MATPRRKPGKIVVDEFLMFLQNKIEYLPDKPLTQICVDVFDDSAIQKSKTILFNILNIPSTNTKPRPARDVVEIITILRSLDPGEVIFVARDLEQLPFVTYGNVDETHRERKIAVLHGTSNYNTVGYVYEDTRDPINDRANVTSDLFLGQAVDSAFTKRFGRPKARNDDDDEDENSSRHYNSWEKPAPVVPPKIMGPARVVPDRFTLANHYYNGKRIMEILSANVEKPLQRGEPDDADENKQLMIKQRLGVDVLEKLHEVEMMKEAAGIELPGAILKKNIFNDKPGTSKSTPNNLPEVNAANDDAAELPEPGTPSIGQNTSKSKKPLSKRKQKQYTAMTVLNLLANRLNADGTLNEANQPEIAMLNNCPELDLAEDVQEVAAPVNPDVNNEENASKRKKRLAKLKKKQTRAKAAVNGMPNPVEPDSTTNENASANDTVASNWEDTVEDTTANLKQTKPDKTTNLEPKNNANVTPKEFADVACQTEIEDHACVFKDKLIALKEKLSREAAVENTVSLNTKKQERSELNYTSVTQLYQIMAKKGKAKQREPVKKSKPSKDGKGKVKAPVLIVPIIITNVLPDSTASDIGEYIYSKIGEPVEVHKLDVTNGSENRHTFKLFVPHTKLPLLMKAHFWPEGIVFSMFDNCIDKDRN